MHNPNPLSARAIAAIYRALYIEDNVQNQKARHSGLAASQFILSLPKGMNDSCYICLCHESSKDQ